VDHTSLLAGDLARADGCASKFDTRYKKGFIVDVNVQLVGGKPAGYRVTNVHQVIDLPD